METYNIIAGIINLLTNQEIPLSTITSITNAGVVTSNTTNVAMLIDANNIEILLSEQLPNNDDEYNISDANEYVTVSSTVLANYSHIKIKTASKSTSHYVDDATVVSFYDVAPAATSDSSIDKVTAKYHSYRFGLDKFSASNKKYYPSSAYMIKYENVKSGDAIALIADDYTPNNTSIEYSIIDGNKEIPILPYEVNNIVNEKIFVGYDTRFNVIAGTGRIYYKGSFLENSDDVSHIDSDGYYISYTTNASSSYEVERGNISIKIVMRMYDGAEVPPKVNSLLLRRVS